VVASREPGARTVLSIVGTLIGDPGSHCRSAPIGRWIARPVTIHAACERVDVSSVPGSFFGVVLARPEGLEHAPPTIVIEGVDELVVALRAAEAGG
jgi:hypothetical protein